MMKNERKRTFLLITLPILALFICFNTVPLIRGVVYSFTNFKGFGTFDWVGLRNYIDLFQDSRVGGSYLFTFKLAIVSTIVTNVIGLMLALGLNSKIRAKGLFRALYFLPNVLGALVVGYVFQYLFTYILPALGEMIGSEALSSSMLSNEKTAWIAIMIVCCWQNIAMTTIIYISGLQTVPEDVYEAGSLDGATGWKTVPASDVSADHTVLYHQYGAVREELPDGIRPDHGDDQGRTGAEYGIHFLPDLQ